MSNLLARDKQIQLDMKFFDLLFIFRLILNCELYVNPTGFVTKKLYYDHSV